MPVLRSLRVAAGRESGVKMGDDGSGSLTSTDVMAPSQMVGVFCGALRSLILLHQMHHRAKFRGNGSNRYRDMAIFRIFKMAAAAMLDGSRWHLARR